MTCAFRTPTQLHKSLHRQLNSYALAASAAGVGMLALAQPAEGKVIYTKTHRVINAKFSIFNLDLNHDGVLDFTLYLIQGTHVYSSGLFVKGCTFSRFGSSCVTNSVWTSGSPRSAAALPQGFVIGRKGKRVHSALMEGGSSNRTSSTLSSGGNWLNVKARYLGLRFMIKGKPHFGWARLNASYPPAVGVLTGYAYETISGKPIITGDTRGPDVITVQEGSLGALAAGRK